MESLSLTLVNKKQAWNEIQNRLYPALGNVLNGERKYTLTLKPETRSIEQNRRMWKMLTEISEQVEWYGHRLSPEDWKNILSASQKKQRAVPGIDGGFVVLGQSTSKMTVAEMTELMDLMDAFGAQQGVKFSVAD